MLPAELSDTALLTGWSTKLLVRHKRGEPPGPSAATLLDSLTYGTASRALGMHRFSREPASPRLEREQACAAPCAAQEGVIPTCPEKLISIRKESDPANAGEQRLPQW